MTTLALMPRDDASATNPFPGLLGVRIFGLLFFACLWLNAISAIPAGAAIALTVADALLFCVCMLHATRGVLPSSQSTRAFVALYVIVAGCIVAYWGSQYVASTRSEVAVDQAAYRRIAETLAIDPSAIRLIASARVDGVVTNGEYARFRSDVAALEDAKARARVLGNR